MESTFTSRTGRKFILLFLVLPIRANRGNNNNSKFSCRAQTVCFCGADGIKLKLSAAPIHSRAEPSSVAIVKALPVGISQVIMWEKAHLTMANSGNSQPRMLPIKLIFIVFRISSSKLYSLRNAIPSLVCARRLELWEREVLFLPRQPTGPTSERKEKQQTVASTSTPRRRRKEGKEKAPKEIVLDGGGERAEGWIYLMAFITMGGINTFTSN